MLHLLHIKNNMECKKFKKKHICKIILGDKKALNIIHKEAYLFGQGVVYIGTENGTVHIFSTRKLRDMCWDFQFYLKQGEENVISLAGEEKYLCEWKQVFIFLFDEDGAFLSYTSKECLDKVGMRKLSTGKSGLAEAWSEAINISSFLSPILFEEVKNLKNDINNQEISMLQGGGEFDW